MGTLPLLSLYWKPVSAKESILVYYAAFESLPWRPRSTFLRHIVRVTFRSAPDNDYRVIPTVTLTSRPVLARLTFLFNADKAWLPQWARKLTLTEGLCCADAIAMRAVSADGRVTTGTVDDSGNVYIVSPRRGQFPAVTRYGNSLYGWLHRVVAKYCGQHLVKGTAGETNCSQ